jgi:hypothetical protein
MKAQKIDETIRQGVELFSRQHANDAFSVVTTIEPLSAYALPS